MYTNVTSRIILLCLLVALITPLLFALLQPAGTVVPHTLMGCTDHCVCHAVDQDLDEAGPVPPIMDVASLLDAVCRVQTESPLRSLDHPPQLSCGLPLTL